MMILAAARVARSTAHCSHDFAEVGLCHADGAADRIQGEELWSGLLELKGFGHDDRR